MASLDEYFDSFKKDIQEMRMELQLLRQELQQFKRAEKVSFTLTEAAAATGLSRENIFKKCKEGKIAFTQACEGGMITIERKDLEKYLFDNSSARVDKQEAPVIRITSRAGKILSKYHNAVGG